MEVFRRMRNKVIPTHSSLPNEVARWIRQNDDYKGGNFLIAENEYETAKGSAIVFPSNFMFPHAVKKVEKGTRYSIVTWLM